MNMYMPYSLYAIAPSVVKHQMTWSYHLPQDSFFVGNNRKALSFASGERLWVHQTEMAIFPKA